MTMNQTDAMEEFFDFARLELDGGLQVRGDHMPPNDSVTAQQPDCAMDWQFSTPAEPVDFAALTPNSLNHAILDASSMPQPYHNQMPLSGPNFPALPAANGMAVHPEDALLWDSSSNRAAVNLGQGVAESISTRPASRLEFSESRLFPQEFQKRQQVRVAAAPTRKPASAKRKGPSTRIPLEAKQMLEEEFATNPYPCNWELDIIAHQANLDVKRVRNWYNNTRARKKGSGLVDIVREPMNVSSHSLASKLSKDSLEALDKEADEVVSPPQPPLAVYLAQSYNEEAATFSDILAAMDNSSVSDVTGFHMDTSSSGSRIGRPGSVITSITSSDGTLPSIYTVSSSGSNMSSFGRDRRRGRRRMAWQASPYPRTKSNGLNSAGVPQDDLPFFCTFCPRAFKTKYEWIRHEDSVHALRTTWICCDTKNAPLQTCPFCGIKHPDEYHLASHRYQQCRNKPESQRTFYRRDHFVQHLHHVHFANVKHPSVHLGCQARLMAPEGHNFGCKDLAMKWRRFGAPMKADDPMLHCGFCGKKSKNWGERCDHVAEHFIAGEFDRSSWWAERLENHLENFCTPQSVGPFRCRYCKKVFANRDAMNKHTHCRVYSCRFLKTFDDLAAENASPPLCAQFPSPKAHHCHLCGAGYRSFHTEHAKNYHRYRSCEQSLYTSEAEFFQHLQDAHGASHTELLQNVSRMEQNFSRNKGASFELVDLNELMQGCRDATESAFFVDPLTMEEIVKLAKTIQGRSSLDPVRTPPRRNTEERIDRDVVSMKGRKHSNISVPVPAPQGPRFFRLKPLVPFLSSRIYYLRNAKPASLFSDGKAVLEEVSKGHIASLVMSSGLVGMASARLPMNLKRDVGMAEFTLGDDDGD